MYFRIYIYIYKALLIINYVFYAHCEPLNGRYTRGIVNYQLAIPRKLNENGDFATFQIPHFFEYSNNKRRPKRDFGKSYVDYGITLDDDHHVVQLWPNHNFITDRTIFEENPLESKVQHRKFRKPSKNLCYYYGKIKDKPQSKVALSTCDGLSGYVYLDGHRYFIEPLADHTPNKHGQYLHIVHDGDKPDQNLNTNPCGTKLNWEEAWKQRFEREFSKNKENFVNKRNTQSVERYLELLVVADKKFLEYHKNTDYDTYVLTIMNMVEDYFHDSSTGHQMNVVVVRVMYLEKEEEEIDLAISRNADDTLASFCKWQILINPKDLAHPNHHDIAVLLTRYDICADNMQSCGLMGLAYVATACTPDKPCCINEDSGLLLGLTVAHEVGHVMGCSHDNEEDSSCKPQAEDKSYYIMSPFVHGNTNVWSTCSKTFMTEFFDNNLGECLNDEPQESLYKDNGMLPGAMYDAAYQCNMAYPGSDVCESDPETFCERLMCRTSPTICTSNGEPPADGTKCGSNMWCYDTKCIEIGERPLAINGGWGTFGNWSTCSRTCGGGVSYSERECNNPAPLHKGRYCLGEKRKYTICNTQPCPEGSKSFRAEQCSEYDAKQFRDKQYKWDPFFKEDEPCVLYCVNTDRVFSKLAPRAKDGTKCKRGTKNMCISGVCKKIGCDYVIDSDSVDDDCGICKGDGTQCKLVSEVYSGTPGHGYVKVTMIPKGSRNVFVEEKQPSDNTIAISAKDEKKFYLNGEFTEKQDGDYDFGGVEGIYSHPEPNKENLVIYGPLKEDIVLFVVYYTNDGVGYEYKYAEPAAQTSYQPHYHWEFVEWGECSVRCGGGTETADPECMEEKSGKVSPCYCQVSEKPPQKVRTCNEQPCKTKWRVGKWSKCTACKFQSGFRTREVECVREAHKPGQEDILVDDEKCPGERPGTRELCNAHTNCVKTKRQVDRIPNDVLQHLWFQTMDTYMKEKPIRLLDLTKNKRLVRQTRRNIIKSRLKRFNSNSESCDQKSKSNLKNGTIVQDKIPPEEVKVIQVPLKQSHTSLNLTDSAFESMGDKLVDSLDTCNEKVITGTEAAELLKELQHRNQTDKTT